MKPLLLMIPLTVMFSVCRVAYDFDPSTCYTIGFAVGLFSSMIIDAFIKDKKPNVVGHMTVTPLDENTGVMVEGLQIRGSLTLDMRNSGRTAIVSNNRIDASVNHAGVELKA